MEGSYCEWQLNLQIERSSDTHWKNCIDIRSWNIGCRTNGHTVLKSWGHKGEIKWPLCCIAEVDQWLCFYVFVWKVSPAGCRVGGFSFLLESEQITWGRSCLLLHPKDNMEGESIYEVDSGDELGGKDAYNLFLFSSQMTGYREPLWQWTSEATKPKCDKDVYSSLIVLCYFTSSE